MTRGKSQIHIDQPTKWQSMELGSVIAGWFATSDSLDTASISVDGSPVLFHLVDREDIRAAHPFLNVSGFFFFYKPQQRVHRLTITLGDAKRSERMTMSAIAEQEWAALIAPAWRRPRGRFFRIRTGATSRLGVDVIDGYILNVDDGCENARFGELFAYVANERENVAFLLAPGFIRVHPNVVGHRVLPMGMCPTSPPHCVSLYDLQRRVWLCVNPHLNGSALGVVVDREVIADWERLSLELVGEDSNRQVRHLLARQIDDLLAQPLTKSTVVGLNEGDAGALSAIGLVSHKEEWRQLAREALYGGEVIRALERVFPEDYYLESGLARLHLARHSKWPIDSPSYAGLTWHLGHWFSGLKRHTPKCEPEVLPKIAASDLSRDSQLKLRHDNEYTYHSFTFSLNAMARQEFRPKKRFCVLATARNEGPYLLEWIAYYLHLGVDTVLIYTNNNTDGSDDLLAALHSAGVIHWVQNEVEEGTVAQHKAYAHAFAVSPITIDHDWVLTVDLDEFLVLDRKYFPTLHEWVFWLERRPIDVIVLNWRFCGPNGQRDWSDEFIMRRFASEDGHFDQTIKSMCRPQRVIGSNEHFPVAYYREPLSFVDDRGVAHIGWEGNLSFTAVPSSRYAWINHYWNKSAQEFLWKWSRNRGNEPLKVSELQTFVPEFALENFVRRFADVSQPSTEALGIEAAVLGVQQTLLALPGVAKANAAIKTQFTRQLTEVQARLLSSSSILEGGEYGDAFLRIIGS